MLRLDDWQAIRELAKQGLTISATVKVTGFSRNTVKKHLRSPPPAPAKRERLDALLLDPFRDHIRSRIADFDLTPMRLFHGIHECGYASGSHGPNVHRAVAD